MYSRKRDIFYSGIISFFPTGGLTLNLLQTACGSVGATTSSFYPYAGGSWYYGTYDQTWYNHAFAPNSKIPDCAAEAIIAQRGPKTTYALVAARSGHNQGVNCVFMDGHTGFISNEIDLAVWMAIASRAGSETVDLNY